MKVSLLFPLALWAIPSALANFEAKDGRDCAWFGTAPICGSTSHSVGDVDEEWKLIDTTEEKTRAAACYKMGFPSEIEPNPCLDDYGEGCITGYKRLWCR